MPLSRINAFDKAPGRGQSRLTSHQLNVPDQPTKCKYPSGRVRDERSAHALAGGSREQQPTVPAGEFVDNGRAGGLTRLQLGFLSWPVDLKLFIRLHGRWWRVARSA